MLVVLQLIIIQSITQSTTTTTGWAILETPPSPTTLLWDWCGSRWQWCLPQDPYSTMTHETMQLWYRRFTTIWKSNMENFWKTRTYPWVSSWWIKMSRVGSDDNDRCTMSWYAMRYHSSFMYSSLFLWYTDYLQAAVSEFSEANISLQSEIERISTDTKYSNENVVRIINNKLMNIERAFIRDEGLPGEPFYK